MKTLTIIKERYDIESEAENDMELFDVDSENNWLMDGGDNMPGHAGGINTHSLSKGHSHKTENY